MKKTKNKFAFLSVLCSLAIAAVILLPNITPQTACAAIDCNAETEHEYLIINTEVVDPVRYTGAVFTFPHPGFSPYILVENYVAGGGGAFDIRGHYLGSEIFRSCVDTVWFTCLINPAGETFNPPAPKRIDAISAAFNYGSITMDYITQPAATSNNLYTNFNITEADGSVLLGSLATLSGLTAQTSGDTYMRDQQKITIPTISGIKIWITGGGAALTRQNYNVSLVVDNENFLNENVYVCVDRDNNSVCDNTECTYQCSDGVNNDGDAFTDFPADPGCTSALDPDESSNWTMSTVGSEFPINSTTLNAQDNPAVTIDPNGNFIVSWSSFGQDTDNYGIFSQRYDNTGATAGGEFQVNTTFANAQEDVDIGVDANGNFVVVWADAAKDGSGYGIYAQRYDSTGATVGGETQVNTYTSGNQINPSVGMKSNGDYIITWTSFGGQDGNLTGIFAQRFDRFGNKVCPDSLPFPTYCPDDANAANGVEPEFRANVTTAGNQTDSSVAMSEDGSFVLTWKDYDQEGGGNHGIYAQKYATDGTPGGELHVNTFTSFNQANPSVGINSTGEFVIAWDSNNQDGGGLGIYAQRFDSSGTKVCRSGLASPANCGSDGNSINGIEPEFLVNSYITSTQHLPAVVMNTNGNFVIAWRSLAQDTDNYGVYSQAFDNEGNTVGTETQVNTYTSDDQNIPSLAISGNNNYIIAWDSLQDASSYGVYSQRYDMTQSIDCPNNVKDIGEVCDGTDIGGATCSSVLGSTQLGTVSCNPGCLSFDTSACSSDEDGDGIPSSTDNCPSVYNPLQTDTDGSGVGDDCNTGDEAMRVDLYLTNGPGPADDNQYIYENLTGIAPYILPATSCLEYSLSWASADQQIAVDLKLAGYDLRETDILDQKGHSPHAADGLSGESLIYPDYYYRNIDLSSLAGKTIEEYMIVGENDTPGNYTAYIKDIHITDCAGTVLQDIYSAGGSLTHSPDDTSHASNTIQIQAAPASPNASDPDGDEFEAGWTTNCADGDITNCADNCPADSNPLQEDTDGSGVGDECNFGLGNDPDDDEYETGWTTACTDGDITNCADNCPADSNPLQEDTDGSSVGDACNTGTDPDGDEYETGWTAPCTDGDTTNCADNCPNDFDPTQADLDGSGVGDLCNDAGDVDGDDYEYELGWTSPCTGGVNSNCADNCPSNINPLQADVDADGVGDACPNTGTSGTALIKVGNQLRTMDFDTLVDQPVQLAKGVDFRNSTDPTELFFTGPSDVEIFNQVQLTQKKGFLASILDVLNNIMASIWNLIAYQLNPEPESLFQAAPEYSVPGGEAYFIPDNAGNYTFKVEAKHLEGLNTTGIFTVTALDKDFGYFAAPGTGTPGINCNDYIEQNKYWSRLSYIETGVDELDEILVNSQITIKSGIPDQCERLIEEEAVPLPKVTYKAINEGVDSYYGEMKEIYQDTLKTSGPAFGEGSEIGGGGPGGVLYPPKVQTIAEEFHETFVEKEPKLKEYYQKLIDELKYGKFYDFPNASRFSQYGISNVEMINQIRGIFSGLMPGELLGPYLNLVKYHAVIATLRIHEDPEGIFQILLPAKNIELEMDYLPITKRELFDLIDNILGLSMIFDINDPLQTLGINEDLSDLDQNITRDKTFTIYYRLWELSHFMRSEFEILGFTFDDNWSYLKGTRMTKRETRVKYREMLLDKYGSLARIKNLLQLQSNSIISDYWSAWHEFLDLEIFPFPEIKGILFSSTNPLEIFESLKELID